MGRLKGFGVKTCIITVCAMLMAALPDIVSRQGLDIYTVLKVGFAAWICITELPGMEREKENKKIDGELLTYLAKVRRKFMACKNVPISVEISKQGFSEYINRQADIIRHILLSGDRREKVAEYTENKENNRFLKLFLVQAYSASEYGDYEGENGRSGFAENIELLRMEIMRELHIGKRTKYMFAGYMAVGVLPVFFSSVIKAVGTGFSYAMGEFYNGSGRIVLLLGIVTSYAVFDITHNIRNGTNNDRNGYCFKRFRFVSAIIDRLTCKMTVFGSTDRNKVRRMLVTTALTFAVGIEEVIKMKGRGAGIMAVSVILALMTPVLSLFFEKRNDKEKQKDEIRNFETIILMERKLPEISVTGLLKDMEMFSECFREDIRKCITGYCRGAQTALQNMGNECTRKCSDFTDIAEGFSAIDEIGIYDAFSELKDHRTELREMRELEETIREDKGKNLLEIISRIPGAVMLFGYFVIPFVSVSVSEMETLFILLEDTWG